MMKRKQVISILFFFLSSLIVHSQTAVLSENFTTYSGTAASAPVGWTISNNACYTSAASAGASGPNSYKFSVNNATIITPNFSGADSLKFWIKGQSTDALSALTIEQTSDNSTWAPLTIIGPLPTTGTKYSLGISINTVAIRFVYTKSAGNLALDDFLVSKDSVLVNPNGSVLAYFNHPVNNAISNGLPAIYLNNCIDDTLAAYINRAQSTIDLAVYNYTTNGSDSMDVIANAINAAYTRGVVIRWIHDGGTSNTALPLLNPGIPLLASPTGGSYTIMHNKFVVIDAAASNPTKPIVWTGSCNFTRQQIKDDYNNIIIVQDPALAARYTVEFNQMWGSTTTTPNISNSKFGSFKQDMGQHYYNVGGIPIEVYFSPSDGTNSKINATINSADSSLHFGVYSFTDSTDANSIKAKYMSGLFVNGIMDNSSQPYSAYSILNPVMGSDLKIFSVSNFLYHSKMLLVDEDSPSSDPTVLTGSHNWSSSANTKNDENTLIIHSATIANVYYQSYCQNYATMGGTPCSAPLALTGSAQEEDFNLFPNPSNGRIYIQSNEQALQVNIINSIGSAVKRIHLEKENLYTAEVELEEGIYFVISENDNKERVVKRLVIAK